MCFFESRTEQENALEPTQQELLLKASQEVGSRKRLNWGNSLEQDRSAMLEDIGLYQLAENLKQPDLLEDPG